MKLSELNDEDLRKVAMMKTRKGTYTSEAKRAQQILYSRHISHGGYGVGKNKTIGNTNLNNNITREYKSFKELNGYDLLEGNNKESGN